MVPWVCEDNAKSSWLNVTTPKQSILWVTLSWLASANSTYQVQHGMDMGVFSQFEGVLWSLPQEEQQR